MKQGPLSPSRLFPALILALTLGALPVQANEASDIKRLLDEGKFSQAQTLVDRLLAARPREPQLRLYKGLIQRETGHPAEAVVTFTRLTEDHPHLPEPYNNLAVIYAAQGQYEKARQVLEKALRTHPSYATAHDNLGEIYAQLASQAYSRALQIDAASASSPPARLTLLRELTSLPTPQPSPQLAAGPVVMPPVTAKPATPTTPPPVATPPASVAAAVAAAPSQPATAATAPQAASKPAAAAPLRPAAPPASTPAAAATIAAAPTTTPTVQKSPPPASARPAATPGGDSRPDVEQAVQAWARAWATKDMERYLAAYGKDFATPAGMSRAAWEEERRLRIVGKSRIAVTLLELQIQVQGERAVAKFRQDYKADSLAVLSRKTLELVRSGDRWLIVRESTGH